MKIYLNQTRQKRTAIYISPLYIYILLLIFNLPSVAISQCTPLPNLGCTPAAFISASYNTTGYACRGDNRTLSDIINWSGTSGAGPNSTSTEGVVFMISCGPLPLPVTTATLPLYWNNFTQGGKLELDDEVGDYINCSGAFVNPVGGGSCTGSIWLIPITVVSIVGTVACYDVNCFATGMTPIQIQLGAICPTAVANPSPTCEGQPVTLTGGGGQSYEWSDGLGNTSSVIAMPTVNPTSYTVTVTNTMPVTCTGETTVIVNVISNVPTTFNPIGPLCQNSTPPALPTASNNSPPILGTWSPAIINTSAPGATTYTFTPNIGECGTIYDMIITIEPSIMPNVGPFGPFCINETPPILPPISNDMPGISGTWNPPAINTSTAGSSIYTFTPDPGSCSIPTTINITVNLQTVPVFAPIMPLCINSTPPTLPVNSDNIPPITGTWSPSTINTSSPGSSIYTFTPDANQCAASTTISITIEPELIPVFSTIPDICQNEAPPTLLNSSNNSPPIFGMWNPAVINTSTEGTFNYTFTPNANECASAMSINVTINPELSPTFNSIGPLCQNSLPPALPSLSNDSPSISGTWSPAVINTNFTGNFIYTFTGNNAPCAESEIIVTILPNVTPAFAAFGPYCLNEIPPNLPTTSNNGITGTWVPAAINTSFPGLTNYTFTPDPGECGTTTTISVNVNSPISPAFTFQTIYCQNDSPTALPAISDNGISGTWSPSSISTLSTGNFIYTFTPNIPQCATPIGINITINIPTIPTFVSANLSFCQNTSALPLPATSTNGISGTWLPPVISTSTVGSSSYLFTPNAPQCATTGTISVDITTPPTPTFNPLPDYCQFSTPGILPNTSLEGITGSWSPTLINTNVTGNSVYLFSTSPGLCGGSNTMSINILSSPNNVNFDVTPASCGNSDGTLTINNVIGGTPPYQFNFNNLGFTSNMFYSNLTAGSFPLEINDSNGCQYSITININNATGPTDIQSVTSPEICNNVNGSMQFINITGGTAPYTYSFDGSPYTANTLYNGLSGGVYSIGVSDANGCIFNSQILIPEVTGPDGISIISVNAGCGNNNGSIILGTVTGGAAPYSFSVDGSQFTTTTVYMNLSSGQYPVIVQDANGCQFSTNTTIGDIPGPTAIGYSTLDASCAMNNGSLEIISVSGGVSPYLYSFNGSPFTNSDIYPGLASGSYTLVVQDVNGCTFSEIVTINNIGGPTNANINSINARCGNANGSINIISVSSNFPPFTYSFNGSPYTNVTSYDNLGAGIYPIIIKDGNGCTYNVNITVNNVPGPTAIAINKTEPTCGLSNGSVLLGNVTSGTAPFTYSFNGSVFTSTTSYNNLGPANYTITIKDANGCEYNTSTTLASPNAPTDIEIFTVEEKCSKMNGAINLGTVTGGMSPFMYSLEGSVFTNITQYASLSNGTYNVTVKDQNGCLFTKPAIVINQTGPTDFQIITTESNCGGTNGSISINGVTGGTGPFLFSFDSSIFSSTTIYSNLAAALYPIIVKDINGCELTKIAQVNNSGGPTNVEVNHKDATCDLPNGAINIGVVTNGQLPYQYSINNQTFGSQLIYNDLTAGDYVITVKDANGCLYSKTLSILNLGTFEPMIASTVTFCGLSNGSISVLPVGSEYIYSWTGSLNGSNPSNVAAGNYTVTVTNTTFGCTKTTDIIVAASNALMITCNPTGVSTSNGNDGVSNISFLNGSSPYNITWDGTAMGNLNNISSNSYEIQNLKAGSYTVTVTDKNNCTAICNFTIIDKDCNMTAEAQGSITSCFGGNDGKIILNIEDAEGNTNITWSNNAWNGLTNISNVPPGSYAVTITDDAACTVTENVLIGQPSEIVLSCSASGITSLGVNDGKGFIDVMGGTPNYTVDWTGPSMGTTKNIAQGVYTISGLMPGTYLLTVTDNNGCHKNCQFIVQDTPCQLKSNISVTELSCADECDGELFVNVTNQQGNVTIDWGNPIYNGNFNLKNLCPGIYAATVTDEEDCISQISYELIPVTDWTMLLSTNKNQVLVGENVNLLITTSLNINEITSISWTSNPQLSCFDCINPVAKMIESTIFEVTVTDINGCSKTQNILISVRQIFDIYFPNIINITSENQNSSFYPIGDLNKVNKIKRLNIYDRWGNLIFNNLNFAINDKNQGWSGMFNGSKVNPGVYVYFVECEFTDGSTKQYKGDLTVIR